MKIFYDVDTQKDFMNENGALYVPGAEDIKPNLARLTQYAAMNKIPVFGSVDRHFGTKEYKDKEKELRKWGGPFPDHCMDGTEGVEKIVETLAQGKYFEKQSYDVFTNPEFEQFLEKSGIGEATVYGVATDYCVKAAVLGMQKRGIQCYVVEDAIKGVAPGTTEQAINDMKLAGAKFVTTQQILEARLK